MAELLLWREATELGLSPAVIQRRLNAGDDVEGLADLPIREMIDHLKQAFPAAQEIAGYLQWRVGEAKFRATWTWQHIRFETDDLSDEDRELIFDVARHFHCPVFDPLLNLRMGSDE